MADNALYIGLFVENCPENRKNLQGIKNNMSCFCHQIPGVPRQMD